MIYVDIGLGINTLGVMKWMGCVVGVIAAVSLAIVLTYAATRDMKKSKVGGLDSDLTAILAGLRLDPFGRPVAPTAVTVKGGPVYFVATGIASVPPADELQQVRSLLRMVGYTIEKDQAVERFLGWEILATKESGVILVSVGSRVVEGDGAVYPPLVDRSYVQIAIAGRDSTPQWSHVDTGK